MKTFLSLTLATCLFAQTSMAFARTSATATVMTSVQKAESLQLLVNNFKHKVYAEGKNVEASIKELSASIIENRYTIADLQLFVQLNAEPQEVEKFNKAVSIAFEDVKDMKSLSSEELAFILKNAMSSTTQTGANFMSCGVGIGVGIPLIAVGVIIGIVALANATASKEVVTKEYIERRQQTTESYLNTKADLELEVTTYKSDIVFYNDEIKEINRKISSGNYGAVEVENMRATIREYEFMISDANALLGEVQVDLDYFNSKYETDLTALNGQETSSLAKVDEKRANSSKQAVTAGIAAAIGSVFLIGGVSDCN